ncbi:MAG TPA: polysaccharide biosynthesis/export family protein, partial [Gemmataceae bacterium]|nr:polysaccharide biosynthesis/export family protein [Gemmataceae bacterium]
SVAVLAPAGSGCLGHGHYDLVPEPPAAMLAAPGVPSELNMITLPPYAIGSPDILLISVYTEPRDKGGPATVIGPQPIDGQHLVRPDGTVNLGIWGSVSVAGLTTDQAREAVRRHVFEVMRTHPDADLKFTQPDDPSKLYVAVDVVGYNSKAYYVITDGAGFGEQIFRFPIQGYETVLDALSNVNGLPAVGSKHHVWVARRTPHANQPEQILPVDYVGLTQHGITQTNYQILPGDRVYVRADKAFRVDGFLQKVLTPVERLLGLTLLGSSTYNSVTNRRQSGTGQ